MKKINYYLISSGMLIAILSILLVIQFSPLSLPKTSYEKVITRTYQTEDERYALEVAETFNYSKLLNTSHTSSTFKYIDNITINTIDENALNISNSGYIYLNYTAQSTEEQNITLSLNNASNSQDSYKKLVISSTISKILVNKSIFLVTDSNIYYNFGWKFYEFNNSLNNFTFIDHEFSYMLNSSNYFIGMYLYAEINHYYNILTQLLIIDKTFQPIFIIIMSAIIMVT